MVGTFWALVPPIVAIVLALITKETYSSLFVGILVGALFVGGFHPVASMDVMINDGFIGAIADGWNAGTILPVGGSYDDDGNIWDAIVEFNAANDYLGTYSGTVEEGTYHKVTFYTEEPMPEGVAAMVMNIGLNWDTWEWTFDPVENEQEGYGTTALTVTIPSSYNSLYVGYYGDESLLPLRVRFTKIVREVFEKEIPTAIEGTQADATAKVVRVEFFNAAGAKLAQPTKGMTIVRETLSDGTMRSKKVMKK